MKFFAVFLLSVAVLVLEVLQMRFYSLAIWHHLAYMVITVALLGFGAAGSILYAFPNLIPKDNPYKRMALFSLLFSVSLFVAFIVTCRLPLDTFQLLASPPEGMKDPLFPVGEEKPLQLLYVFIYYLALLPTYFFAGIVIAGVFAREARQAAQYYFYNLAGSAIGSFGVVALITPMGGEGLAFAVAALGALAALVFAASEKKVPKGIYAAATAFLILLVVLFPFRKQILNVHVADTKALGIFKKLDPNLKTEYVRWDPVARIDVVSSKKTGKLLHVIRGLDHKIITIDGDAYTYLYRFPKPWPEFEPLGQTLYASAYWIKPHPKDVLAVGLGGGIDIATALHHRAEHITGVELNAAMIDVTGRAFADFDNHIYQQPQVNIVHSEGRSFLKRNRGKYDIIQMSGVDTWSALASGAYVLSENYLYTVEAISEYLDRLKDDGVLCIIRWLFSPPRETLRLASVAAEALKERGIKNPSKHMALMTHSLFAALLIKPKAFTQSEIQALMSKNGLGPDGAPLIAAYLPGVRQIPTPFHELLGAYDLGEEQTHKFFEKYRFDVTPVHDDKPFFFRYYKWKDFFGKGLGIGGSFESMFPVGLWILLLSLIQAVIFSLVLILAPIFWANKRGISTHTKRIVPYVVLYFAALGTAYMLIEIGLMQKLVLYLGHPSYSIAVTLASLLFFSGVGSIYSNRFEPGWKMIRNSLIAVVTTASVVLFILLPAIISTTLGMAFSSRVIIVIMLLAPIGFVMGMPFPSAVRMLGRLDDEHDGLIAWGVGANGVMSVVASIGAIALAMAIGFTAVMIIGIMFYLLALGAAKIWESKAVLEE